MIRIHTARGDEGPVIFVEGRLAGMFVPELDACCKSARAAHPGSKLTLDLKGVTCIDRAGRYLLEMLHENGAEFRGAGLGLQDVLAEIAANDCHSKH